LGRIEREAICENGEDEGMKNLMPVGMIKAPNRVPKDAEGADG